MAQQLEIFLASSSPRRIELLTQIGLKITVRSPNVDEKRLPRETPQKMVARLARAKAEFVAEGIPFPKRDSDPAPLVIAADTIVVAPDGKTILGKPRNTADAAKMLNMLSGKTHTVYTGYCILETGLRETGHVVRVVRSRVKMRPLSREDIRNYIATKEPMDKAGSYAAQGLGMTLIDSLQGSYTNVVGLPVCQVAADLENVFGLSLFQWKPVR